MNEIYTTRSPILPPRLFRVRTTAFILISTFFHALAFFAGAYYLPIYFQVLGSSATGAGVRMLPYSLAGAAVSAISGQIVTRTGKWRPTMWFSWVIIVLGYGLMIQLDEKSNTSVFSAIYSLFSHTADSNPLQFTVPRRCCIYSSQHSELDASSRPL